MTELCCEIILTTKCVNISKCLIMNLCLTIILILKSTRHMLHVMYRNCKDLRNINNSLLSMYMWIVISELEYCVLVKKVAAVQRKFLKFHSLKLDGVYLCSQITQIFDELFKTAYAFTILFHDKLFKKCVEILILYLICATSILKQCSVLLKA